MNRNEEYFALVNALEENAPDLHDSIQKAKRKRNKLTFIYQPLAGLAACFALFVLLVNFSAPIAQACSNLPVLRELAAAVTFSRSLTDIVENNYVQPINLTQEQNGITAKIEYIIVDQKQVNVFYRLESKLYAKMYASANALNANGTSNEPCVLTTPINDVSNDALRLITLDYLDDNVTDSLRLDILAHDAENSNEVSIANFSFQLKFDPSRIANAKIYPVNKTVMLDGQSITICDIQVYPTHMRLNVKDSKDNTALLTGLGFYIETEHGRFDPSGIIRATGTENNKNMHSYRADSIYFYEAQQIKLVLTEARWLNKALQKIRLNLRGGDNSHLPHGITMVPNQVNGSESPFKLHISMPDHLHPMLMSMVYYDTTGQQGQAPVAVKECTEHKGNCWYEWLVLEDYEGDHIWICPNYSHDYQVEEPIIIDILSNSK